MGYPENGLYMAHVTDDDVRTFYADEDAVCDAQTDRIFKDRKRDAADQMRAAEEQTRNAMRQAAKRKRRFWYVVKDVLGLVGAASMVYCTYRWGLLVAVGSIVGCMVALCFRIINYITMKGEM